MKIIKYISDLHLERKIKNIRFKNKDLGGYLFIAGDIGSPLMNNYWEFLEYTSHNFDQVFFTTGNHEYWNNNAITIDEINNLIEDKSMNYNNVHFLNNKKVIFNDYEILGSTLWSYPNSNLYNSIDFAKIYIKTNQRLSPKIMRKLYYNNTLWLKNNLINDKPKIILTHYLPSYQFTKKYKKYLRIQSIFASDLEHLINDPIKLWIFGHTHDKFTKHINNVPCTVNALGYKKNIEIDYFELF
jgi:predicted phosphohydrolase